MKIFKLGELFCGPGGLAWGALNAKGHGKAKDYKIVPTWANDYDKDSCETYEKNIGSGKHKVICKDVRKLSLNELTPVDAFAYGFPCNDFSLVGERKGFEGNFGPLYSYGVQIINKFKPKFFVAENVGGIRSANDGMALLKILSDLSGADKGYVLTSHYYKFEDYGIPQTRHRIIIVGIASSLGVKFKVPAPLTKGKPITARQALTIPPISKTAANQELTKQSGDVVKRLQFIKPGQNAWTAEIPRELQLNVKGAKLSQIYRRLHPDKPAYTLTGSGGGGTHGYHWKENRALTNRERARIQTFPDDFVFCGSKESVRKQIGMAVSPKMAQIIFSCILNTLAGVEYKSIPSNFQDKSIVESFLENELSPA